MKNFPLTLKNENKKNFEAINYERLKCYLRRDLYEHIISHTQEEYFSFDTFCSNKFINNKQINKLIDDLIPELNLLGWKCQKAYGDTALFIYDSEKLPSTCW